MIAAMDAGKKRAGGMRNKGPPDILKVVKCIVEQHLEPAIVFAFSRKECEALSSQLMRSGKFQMTVSSLPFLVFVMSGVFQITKSLLSLACCALRFQHYAPFVCISAVYMWRGIHAHTHIHAHAHTHIHVHTHRRPRSSRPSRMYMNRSVRVREHVCMRSS